MSLLPGDCAPIYHTAVHPAIGKRTAFAACPGSVTPGLRGRQGVTATPHWSHCLQRMTAELTCKLDHSSPGACSAACDQSSSHPHRAAFSTDLELHMSRRVTPRCPARLDRNSTVGTSRWSSCIARCRRLLAGTPARTSQWPETEALRPALQCS